MKNWPTGHSRFLRDGIGQKLNSAMNENDNEMKQEEDSLQKNRFDYSKAKSNRFAERLAEQPISIVSSRAMDLVLQKEAPPLHRDSTGALRIGDSRVLLESVVHAFEDGATPETIAQQYPTTTLADIYSAIAYYLHHRDEV